MYVYLNFIEIQLIYNAVLVSSVQQSDSALMRLFKKKFSMSISPLLPCK